MSGADNSNECPAGSVRIEAAAACRIAAAATGMTPGSSFVETNPAYPRGCYCLTSTAWFNAHAVGAGRSGSRLLCAGAPPAPPTRTRRGRRLGPCVCACACMCVCVCVSLLCVCVVRDWL